MDREIQNGIEDYLHGHNGKAQPKASRGLMDPGAAFEGRLNQADAETRREVAEFRQTASMLHQLQTPADVPEPAAGFYARVIERIEAERASNSFWSIFLNPQFSRRLLFASATLLVLLAVTFASTDGNPGWFDTAAPQLVESQPLPFMDDIAAENPSEPIEVGLVSHSESGHNQMLLELTTFEQ
jgi:hypothetical protein